MKLTRPVRDDPRQGTSRALGRTNSQSDSLTAGLTLTSGQRCKLRMLW